MPEDTSSSFLTILIIGKVVTSACNSITAKLQDMTIDKFTGRDFFHPYFQTFIMFIAESLCLVAFYSLVKFSAGFKVNVIKDREEARKKGITNDCPNYVPLLPSVCDITATTLNYAALTYMASSIAVMLNGALPIFTAILSVIFLKRKLWEHHYLALFLLVIGIGTVGFSALMEAKSEGTNILLGLILKIVSLSITAIQYTMEEKILTKRYIHPLKMVGFEGFWGIFVSAIVMIVASYIPCDNEREYCNMGYLENPHNAVYDIMHDEWLWLYFILGTISLGFANFFGISVTKYLSSLTRSVLAILTPVLVWFFDMGFLGRKFYWLQFLGFSLVVLGNLIYNEVVDIPGFDKHTKKKLAAMEPLLTDTNLVKIQKETDSCLESEPITQELTA